MLFLGWREVKVGFAAGVCRGNEKVFSIATKKVSGPSKGKQPAKKAQPKRPAIALSDLEDEGGVEDHKIILDKLAALERAEGLTHGGSLALDSTPRGQMTWQVAQR